MKKYIIGESIDGYKIFDANSNRKGGNGQVYFVKKDDHSFALKLVKFHNETKFLRFKREINIISQESELNGILKIFDFYIQKKFQKNSYAWYTMPIASPVDLKEFSDNSTQFIITKMLYVAKTLRSLHKKGISHRDIKPENLLFFNNELHISDFGLVTYPGALEITRETDRIGPWTTIPPEFKRNAKSSDGKKGDVYSFAKTLWILLTGVKESFDGQYSYKDEKIRLLTYREEKDNLCFRTHPLAILDRLLAEATENQPEKRISIEKVIEYLELFLNTSLEKKIKYEWKFISEILFPYGIPSSAIWTSPADIVTVLKELTYFKNLNHMFFETGGLDLTDASLSNEEGFIELSSDGSILKMKPKLLSFNSFDDSDWNYFFIELDNFDIPKLGYSAFYDSMPVVETTPGKYIPDWCWEYQRDMTNKAYSPLPETARRIELCYNSKYVIFNKRSTYNKESSTYNGYQNYFSNEEFKSFIELCSKNYQLYFYIVKNAYHLSDHFNKEQRASFISNSIKNPKIIFDLIEESSNKEIINYEQEHIQKDFIDNFLRSIDLNFEIDLNSPILYEISINFDDIRYDILSDNSFKEYKRKGLFYSFKFDKENSSTIKKIFDKTSALALYSAVTKLAEHSIYKEKIFCSIRHTIIKKIPTVFLTKETLHDVLLAGNSMVQNTLVVDIYGNLELIENANNKFNISLHPVQINDFPRYSNSVGEFYNENNFSLNHRYEQLLNYYHNFLITKSSTSYVDYFEKPIETLEKEIKEIVDFK